MASIVGNRVYNDPALGAAFGNLAQMFAPPSGSDASGYAAAAATKEKAGRLAELFSFAKSPSFDQAQFDRMNVAGGNYSPNQSYYAVDLGDATTRRGQDVTAATSRANTAETVRGSLIGDLYGPLNQGQVRPGVPTDIASLFGLPAVDPAAGAPKPLSETEWQSTQNDRLRGDGKLTDEMLIDAIIGRQTPVQAVGGDGRAVFMSPGAAVRTGAQPADTGQSAAEEQIARLADNLISTGTVTDIGEARNIAVGIVDGRLRADRNPTTGQLQVVDLATGLPRSPTAPAAKGQGVPVGTAAVDTTSSAPAYPAANDAFGLAGAATGLINTATDVAGFGPAYPDIQQTQSDFAVLRETLLNDIGTAYNRQPPSWLLQQIQELTPNAGNPLEGSGAAQAKLTALDRHLVSELQITQQALQRELTPTNRQELDARQAGLQASIGRVQTALQAFGPAGGPATSSGPQTLEAGAIPRIASDADFDVLPSGAIFVDPEGNTRRKP